VKIHQTLRVSNTKDTRARILAYRAAAEITERITNLMADSGFIDRRIGTLIIDDDGPTTRMPSAVELQQLLAEAVVRPEDLVSPAERDFLYGDQAAYERAARDAVDGSVTRSKNGNGEAY
jgi:hypothetical protein